MPPYKNNLIDFASSIMPSPAPQALGRPIPGKAPNNALDPFGSFARGMNQGLDRAQKAKAMEMQQKQHEDSMSLNYAKLQFQQAELDYRKDPNNPQNAAAFANAKAALLNAAIGQQKMEYQKQFMDRLPKMMGGQQTGAGMMGAPQAGPNQSAAPWAPQAPVSGGGLPPQGGLPGDQYSTMAAGASMFNPALAGILGDRAKAANAPYLAGQEVMAKKQAEKRLALDESIEMTRENYAKNDAELNTLEGLNEAARTGILAPIKDVVVKLGAELGMADQAAALFGETTDAQAARDAMASILNARIVNMIGEGKFPANNFSDADREFLQKIIPQISNTKQANALILKLMRMDNELGREKAEFYDRWRAKNPNGSKAAFNTAWNKAAHARLKSTGLQQEVLKSFGKDAKSQQSFKARMSKYGVQVDEPPPTNTTSDLNP